MARIEIGFIGCDSTDMILYIARLYAATGKKVAVIDYTKKMPLLRVTSLPEALSQSTGYYRDILMLNGTVDHKKDKANQEVLLYNFGYHLSHKELKKCPNIVYVTDMAVHNAQLLKEAGIAEGVSAYLVIRNYAAFKYDENYLAELIGRKFETEHIMLIPYDESDYKSSCYLCVDKNHRLSSLSRSMRMAVLGLFKCTGGSEYSRKEQAALLKRA